MFGIPISAFFFLFSSSQYNNIYLQYNQQTQTSLPFKLIINIILVTNINYESISTNVHVRSVLSLSRTTSHFQINYHN